MELDNLSKRQVIIAKMLWCCESVEEAYKVAKAFGTEGLLIRELMILAAIDDDTKDSESFEEAEEVLNNISKGL